MESGSLRRRLALPAALLLLAAGCVSELGLGAAGLSPGASLRALWGAGGSLADTVVWSLRLPRLLLALGVGGALATCGAAVQAVFRNPLAEPGLIGVSSGAALGAALVLTVLPAGSLSQPWALPLAAFVGAALCTVAIMRLARSEGATSVSTLLLTGVAINAAIGATLGLLAVWASDRGLRAFTLWLFGSLARADWPQLVFAAPLLLAPVLLLPLRGHMLDALLLGEDEARHLGVPVERLKLECLGLVVIGTGAAVATTGVIGFLGLLLPHLARALVGTGHRPMLPLAAVLGAGLLALADALSRSVLAPSELPVGVLTALLGAPPFLWLLLKLRRREDLL
ncbi:MAG: iron ABC transporter permease [Gammaproteobacteria bacterium]|nr:iron ABC transporter permease [Gammaproteobacteria bacterium]